MSTFPHASANESACWVHYKNEPIPAGGAYRICFECKHVFAAAQDLVDAHNRVLDEITGPDDHYRHITANEVDDINSCPECAHDF